MPTNRACTRVLREGTGDVAVFVPFTRRWCVTRFFASLAASDVPLHRCRLTLYADTDDPALVTDLAAASEALPFAEIVLHYTAWKAPAEFAPTRERRGRHGAMRTASAGLIPEADYLLLLEDDTLIPPDSWAKLTAGMEGFEWDAGFDWVCGFEVGRWSCPCPGIWHLTETERRSARPGTGLEQVDATGFYLVLTTPELYRSRRWDYWDKDWGHDVSITWQMTLDGYKLGVDWSLRCVHMTEDGDLTCDTVVELVQRKPGHRPTPPVEAAPLMEFQATGPTLVVGGRPKRPPRDRRRYSLAHDVTHGGSLYPKGAIIGHETAVAMSAAGVIGATIT